jgi:hypothetical protein
MKSSERLMERLRAMGVGMPTGAQFRRVNASESARNAGAWSWYLYRGSLAEIGSQYRVADLLRAPRLLVSQEYDFCSEITVDPAYENTPETNLNYRLWLVEPRKDS